MNAHPPAESLRPVDTLTALIAHHGVIPILLALTAAVLNRRPEGAVPFGALSPHLQRDIGIGPDSGPPWRR